MWAIERGEERERDTGTHTHARTHTHVPGEFRAAFASADRLCNGFMVFLSGRHPYLVVVVEMVVVRV